MDIQKERELFIEHMRNDGAADFMFELDEDGYFDDMSMSYAWRAWQAAKTQAVPEGFVLVPIQPNEKTLIKMSWSVALGEDQHGNSVYLSIDEAKQAYEAVIEAQEQD